MGTWPSSSICTDKREFYRKRKVGIESDQSHNRFVCMDAEELEVQVTKTRKQVFGSEHPHTLISIGNLALTYWNQGRWEDAEELGVQVMETFKQVLGSEHPDTLTSMSNLACTLRSLDRFEAGLQMMTECARLRSQQLGPDHPDTLSSVAILDRWHQKNEVASLIFTGR